MDKVRVGVIGIGNMGSAHASCIYNNSISLMSLEAVCDISKDRLSNFCKSHPNVVGFEDYKQLINSGLVDAVIIATPHYLHPQIAIDAFNFGLHVLTEKPAGVYTKQVREMNRVAQKCNKKFCIMFNQRTNPLFQKASEIIKSGQLGNIKRFVWIVTNWYRTQAYYDSSSWRATWSGEGGGVLLNQAPHNLDIWQWLLGMPKKIKAFCTVGKYHNISVEDDATIYAEYKNGAVATFITSTGEYPGTNRLEISGENGKLLLENSTLTFWELDKNERDVCYTSKSFTGDAKITKFEFSAQEQLNGHSLILKNFAEAILFDKKLISPGTEGLNQLVLSNAAYLSAWTNSTVELPFCEEEFEEYLTNLTKTETCKTVKNDLSKLYKEYSSRWSVKW